MTKHVVVLSDESSSPTPELLAAIRSTGFTAITRVNNFDLFYESETTALAVLYEVSNGVNASDLRQTVTRATSIWVGVPLVASRRPASEDNSIRNISRPLADSVLEYLGFYAVISEPAQLPDLLRQLDEEAVKTPEPGNTNPVLSLPSQGVPDVVGDLVSLPPGLKAKRLRAAFELVTVLHYANNQKQAALVALAGLNRLIGASGWAIHLIAEPAEDQPYRIELLAASGCYMTDETNVAVTEKSGDTASNETSALRRLSREALDNTRTVQGKHARGALLAVPLMSGESVYGVIEVVRTGKNTRSFSRSDTELLEALAIPIASALSNVGRIARAERLSITDDLTKLHNARYLRQYLVSELNRAQRYNLPVAVMFLDLDNFKRVNDQHGHLVGSHVLIELAGVVHNTVRGTDVVARYGGDEFVVVLPYSHAAQAAAVAERIREKVESHVFTGGRDLELHLTASFGVAAFPEHAGSPQQLIGCADTAMYQAKATSKNCVCVATREASNIFREKVSS